jgi:hypothetical protein
MMLICKFLIILISACCFSSTFAQQTALFKEKRATGTIRQVGFFLSTGPFVMNLSDLNRELKSLSLGELDNLLYGRKVGILVNTQPLNIGFNLTAGDSFSSSAATTASPSSRLSLSMLNFGVSFGRHLIESKRVDLLVKLGMDYGSLTYTYNRQGSPSFFSLHTQPASSALVRLVNQDNVSAPLGLQLDYKTHWLKRIGVSEFTIGLNAGYSYYVVKGSWVEQSSGVAVANMPRINPNYLYTLINFSFLFDW